MLEIAGEGFQVNLNPRVAADGYTVALDVDFTYDPAAKTEFKRYSSCVPLSGFRELSSAKAVPPQNWGYQSSGGTLEFGHARDAMPGESKRAAPNLPERLAHPVSSLRAVFPNAR
jgi:hypothetical protein